MTHQSETPTELVEIPEPIAVSVGFARGPLSSKVGIFFQAEAATCHLQEKFRGFLYSRMYSLQQKHCSVTLNEKSMVIFSVNFFEFLHTSTYVIYNYIHRIKNATDDNPEL